MKRRLFPSAVPSTSLEDLKFMLKKYQIEADFFPTHHPRHATVLARNAKKEGYKMVLVAGGDGTVGEAVNGLVNSDLTLGILPLGSYMNVARMLSIPLDLEKAVLLIKVGRTRKIDLGVVKNLSGTDIKTPYYFIESVGLGLEAQIHEHMLQVEQGNWKHIFHTVKTIFEFLRHKAEIEYDNHKLVNRVTLINVANGPYAGPSLPIAPEAKLNDHLLTLSVFKMKKLDLFFYFLRLFFGFKRDKKPMTYKAKKVKITTSPVQEVHADARIYGATPVELEIAPNALNVIAGFSDTSEGIIPLQKRTLLDP